MRGEGRNGSGASQDIGNEKEKNLLIEKD